MTDRERLIAQGRAYVRLIEVADVLLADDPPPAERQRLILVRRFCAGEFRSLAATLPPEITAEILTASEKIKLPTRGFSWN